MISLHAPSCSCLAIPRFPLGFNPRISLPFDHEEGKLCDSPSKRCGPCDDGLDACCLFLEEDELLLLYSAEFDKSFQTNVRK